MILWNGVVEEALKGLLALHVLYLPGRLSACPSCCWWRDWQRKLKRDYEWQSVLSVVEGLHVCFRGLLPLPPRSFPSLVLSYHHSQVLPWRKVRSSGGEILARGEACQDFQLSNRRWKQLESSRHEEGWAEVEDMLDLVEVLSLVCSCP